MSKTTKIKKVAAAGLAAVIAASTAMAGTLAWQSLNQEATNLMTDTVNPGGRLHDDYNREAEAGVYEKNVYVENFGTQKIYARVQLYEFLAKADGLTREKVEQGDFDANSIMVGYKAAADENGKFPKTAVDGSSQTVDNMLQLCTEVYELYDPNTSNPTDMYWTKNWGGSANYIPTFNMNQDSLAADLNGEPDYGFAIINEGNPDKGLLDSNGNETDTTYFALLESGGERTYSRRLDLDDNEEDEGINGEPGENYIETAETHKVATTSDGTVMSMQEWKDAGAEAGPYWVYDTDGWFYWAQAIAPGYTTETDEDGNEVLKWINYETSPRDDGLTSTTGLLLNSLTDIGAIDEDYVYAIHVDGQFTTANEEYIFAETAEDENLSEDVKALLVEIGAVSDGRWGDGTSEDDTGEEDDEFTLNIVGTVPNPANTASVYQGTVIAGNEINVMMYDSTVTGDQAVYETFKLTAQHMYSDLAIAEWAFAEGTSDNITANVSIAADESDPASASLQINTLMKEKFTLVLTPEDSELDSFEVTICPTSTIIIIYRTTQTLDLESGQYTLVPGAGEPDFTYALPNSERSGIINDNVLLISYIEPENPLTLKVSYTDADTDTGASTEFDVTLNLFHNGETLEGTCDPQFAYMEELTSLRAYPLHLSDTGVTDFEGIWKAGDEYYVQSSLINSFEGTVTWSITDEFGNSTELMKCEKIPEDTAGYQSSDQYGIKLMISPDAEAGSVFHMICTIQDKNPNNKMSDEEKEYTWIITLG